MTGAGPKEQGPLPPLLLTLTVVTGVVTDRAEASRMRVCAAICWSRCRS
jgi:hypothetical protein